MRGWPHPFFGGSASGHRPLSPKVKSKVADPLELPATWALRAFPLFDTESLCERYIFFNSLTLSDRQQIQTIFFFFLVCHVFGVVVIIFRPFPPQPLHPTLLPGSPAWRGCGGAGPGSPGGPGKAGTAGFSLRPSPPPQRGGTCVMPPQFVSAQVLLIGQDRLDRLRAGECFMPRGPSRRITAPTY